jgi:hypothetical protein
MPTSLRRWALPCLFTLAVFSLLLPSIGQGADDPNRLYVAPTGDDDWSGTLADPNADRTDGPFATLQRAQQEVRQQNTGGPSTPITVLLRAGVYRQHEPLVFTPEDSGTEAFPVTYAAYPGEHPVISGGVPITRWKQDGHLWSTSVPKTVEGKPWRFNQLFVDDQRRTRARTPNRGQFFRTDGPTSAGANRSFYFHEGDIQQWDRLQDAIAVVYHSWETSIHHIRSVDLESCSVQLREPAPWPMGRWQRQQRYFVENVFEALDEPGEWYWNSSTGQLTYWPMPGETLGQVEIVAPLITSTLLDIVGDPAEDRYVQHLHFRGIAFQHTNANLQRLRNPGQAEIYQPGLIHALGLRHASLVDCQIAAHRRSWNLVGRRMHSQSDPTLPFSRLGRRRGLPGRRRGGQRPPADRAQHRRQQPDPRRLAHVPRRSRRLDREEFA